MKNKSLVFVLIIFLLLISGIGYWYFYNSNSNSSKISISGDNQVSGLSENNKAPVLSEDLPSLPQGYTLDYYKIAEILNNSCQKNSECTTPDEYLIQSNCPFVSLCLENKCTVVCPGNISDQIDYKNTQYGFDFLLPLSWQGYSLINEKWEGRILEASSTNEQIINGPEIIIRHPLWTLENPRQDIPVMIFTYAQWDLVQQEKLSLGAAPIGPSELSRNDNYIFALPARYNYAFPVGFEEVDKIIETKPLKGFN